MINSERATLYIGQLNFQYIYPISEKGELKSNILFFLLQKIIFLPIKISLISNV